MRFEEATMREVDRDHEHEMNVYYQRKLSYARIHEERMGSEATIMEVNHDQKPSKGGWNSAIFIICKSLSFSLSI